MLLCVIPVLDVYNRDDGEAGITDTQVQVRRTTEGANQEPIAPGFAR